MGIPIPRIPAEVRQAYGPHRLNDSLLPSVAMTGVLVEWESTFALLRWWLPSCKRLKRLKRKSPKWFGKPPHSATLPPLRWIYSLPRRKEWNNGFMEIGGLTWGVAALTRQSPSSCS
jgi:hypothetical protein